MTLKAKPILKDKFWIVENEHERIGTLSWNDDRYMFSNNTETCFFDNKRQMKKKFGTEIVWSDISPPTSVTPNDQTLLVHGFPTRVFPYNTMYDIKQKLPLFTKSKHSKSTYCAGYYIICYDKGWTKSFCPKLITVQRYETKGPFKTELEMRQELRSANS